MNRQRIAIRVGPLTIVPRSMSPGMSASGIHSIRSASRAEAAAQYTEPEFSLVAEAVALGMSRTRLVRAFQDVTGLTPHRYLRGLRTTHAARLLAGTTAPVTEICFASGFGSMTRFHAAFHEAFGTTPTGYRARCACDRAVSCEHRPQAPDLLPTAEGGEMLAVGPAFASLDPHVAVRCPRGRVEAVSSYGVSGGLPVRVPPRKPAWCGNRGS